MFKKRCVILNTRDITNFSLVVFVMSASSSLISFFVKEFKMPCKLARYFLNLRIVLSSVDNLCIPYIVPRTKSIHDGNLYFRIQTKFSTC